MTHTRFKDFDARYDDAALLDLQGWIPRELGLEIRALLREAGYVVQTHPAIEWTDTRCVYMWMDEPDGRH